MLHRGFRSLYAIGAMCQELFGNPFLFWDCRNDTRVIGLKPINCELSN